MCEALKPSLEQAMTIMTEEDALDYISKRGSGTQYSRETRIQYAAKILESEFLPHVSTTADGF